MALAAPVGTVVIGPNSSGGETGVSYGSDGTLMARVQNQPTFGVTAHYLAQVGSQSIR